MRVNDITCFNPSSFMTLVVVNDPAINPNHPFARHSRAGGNPDGKKSPVMRGGIVVLSAARDVCPRWISACAGMTQFCANGLSVRDPVRHLYHD